MLRKWLDKQISITNKQIHEAQKNLARTQQMMLQSQQTVLILQGRLQALEETRNEMKVEIETVQKENLSRKDNTKKA